MGDGFLLPVTLFLTLTFTFCFYQATESAALIDEEGEKRRGLEKIRKRGNRMDLYSLSSFLSEFGNGLLKIRRFLQCFQTELKDSTHLQKTLFKYFFKKYKLVK